MKAFSKAALVFAGLCWLAAPATHASTGTVSETVVYDFDVDLGGTPDGPAVMDSAGTFYGTTVNGGPAGRGDLFRVSSDGAFMVLLAFPDKKGRGLSPEGATLDKDGNVYGAAGNIVYELTAAGQERVLHTFMDNDGDLNLLPAAPILGRNGNLYGVTSLGGANDYGEIYRLSADGKKHDLHAFNVSDGAYPDAPLIKDKSGDVFGETIGGGSQNCNVEAGCGTVFEVSADGTFSVLHAFAGGSDGSHPKGGLMLDAAKNLYGTTTSDGDGHCGTVFKLAPDGTLTTLYAFMANGDSNDGCIPDTQLIEDHHGNLFGVTFMGGETQNGTVFEITATGKEKVLYSFRSTPDGQYPIGKLLQAKDGAMYGFTQAGGATGWGTLFKLSRP